MDLGSEDYNLSGFSFNPSERCIGKISKKCILKHIKFALTIPLSADTRNIVSFAKDPILYMLSIKSK